MLAIMFISKRTIQVEWGDCDPQGIVFNPRFFVFFDACTAGLFSAADIDLFSMQKSGKIAGIPMADTRSRFIMPILFGDRVEVRTSAREFRRSSFDICHKLYKNNELAVEGNETRIWTVVDPDRPGGMRSEPLPKSIIKRLSTSVT
jgi:4-hydroxybenzoyl-CoA thioesterase